MRPTLRAAAVIAIAIAAYAAFRLMGDTTRLVPGGSGLDPDLIESVLKIGFWIAPCALAVRVLDRVGYLGVIAALGLRRQFGSGYIFGLAATMPLGFLILTVGPTFYSATSLAGLVIVGPIAEEVLFRGFLLRQLYRRCGWPVAAAIGVSAVTFGLAHLNNLDLIGPHPLVQAGAELFTTISGGVLFAWIAYRWDSVWPAIGLHACLNLAWSLTGPSYGVLVAARWGMGASGGLLLVNVCRLTAVVGAIAITWRVTRLAPRVAIGAPGTVGERA